MYIYINFSIFSLYFLLFIICYLLQVTVKASYLLLTKWRIIQLILKQVKSQFPPCFSKHRRKKRKKKEKEKEKEETEKIYYLIILLSIQSNVQWFEED